MVELVQAGVSAERGSSQESEAEPTTPSSEVELRPGFRWEMCAKAHRVGPLPEATDVQIGDRQPPRAELS